VNGKFPVLQPLTKSWEGCRKGIGGSVAYPIDSRRFIGRKPGDFDGHARRLAGAIIFFDAPEQGFGEACVFSTTYHTKIHKQGVIPPILSIRFFRFPARGFWRMPKSSNYVDEQSV
jgi:hypothetical protein